MEKHTFTKCLHVHDLHFRHNLKSWLLVSFESRAKSQPTLHWYLVALECWRKGPFKFVVCRHVWEATPPTDEPASNAASLPDLLHISAEGRAPQVHQLAQGRYWRQRHLGESWPWTIAHCRAVALPTTFQPMMAILVAFRLRFCMQSCMLASARVQIKAFIHAAWQLVLVK